MVTCEDSPNCHFVLRSFATTYIIPALLEICLNKGGPCKPDISLFVLVEVMSKPAMQQEELRLEQRALRVRATELAAEQV